MRILTHSGLSSLFILVAVACSSVTTIAPQERQSTPIFGVVQSDPARVHSDRAAGIELRTLELAWDAYETAKSSWSHEYIAKKRREYQSALDAGSQVVLDLGLQYPPKWVLDEQHSRYVDQNGNEFSSGEPGASQANAVFNARIRAFQERYVRRVFAELNIEPYAVRLGWGWYGELGYPPIDAGQNSYWAYDDIAQGKEPGLPQGMRPAPQLGWRPPSPGTQITDTTRESARLFTHWYLESLANYQQWQQSLLRELYDGRLFVLFPSFGLRPGDLESAINTGLTGQTPAEVNAELQRGFDFKRLVDDIDDGLTVPYTTWLDADGWFVDDSSTNRSKWSPIKYLSVLAEEHPMELELWGENTGENRLANLNVSIERVRKYELRGMFWAFNADLYNGGEVSIRDYAAQIAANPPLGDATQ